jgi:hypothetical protein
VARAQVRQVAQPAPQPAPQSFASTSTENPFGRRSTPVTYDDPESGTRFDISPGHALYRDPATRRLRVVSLAELPAGAGRGDQPGAGKLGCSATGVGIVTPECENTRRARANPFGNGQK